MMSEQNDVKMERGKVFIGWGSHSIGDKQLAEQVAAELKKQGFLGIVGGQDSGMSIWEDVDRQIRSACGAIMLFAKRVETPSAEQKKACKESCKDACNPENGGECKLSKTTSPSGNMLFELGYIFGLRRNSHRDRILSVYLNLSEDDIPTDLHGMWHESIPDAKIHSDQERQDQDRQQLAERIVKAYLQKQRVTLDEDQFVLMSKYFELRRRVADLHSTSFYNEEMARYILLLGQSAYIYNDFDRTKWLLQSFWNHDNSEIIHALSFCVEYFDFSAELRPNTEALPAADASNAELRSKVGRLSCTTRVYNRFCRSVMRQLRVLDPQPLHKEWDPNIPKDAAEKDSYYYEFRILFCAIAYECLTFANMVYYGNQAKELEFRLQCCQRSVKYCDLLVEKDSDSYHALTMYLKSYVLRNEAILRRDCPECSDEKYAALFENKTANKLFEESNRYREQLDRLYGSRQNLDHRFRKHIQMEYFLGLSDNLETVDAEEREYRLYELQQYIEETEEKGYDHQHIIEQIRMKTAAVQKLRTEEAACRPLVGCTAQEE